MSSKIQCPECGEMFESEEMVISVSRKQDGQLICKYDEERLLAEEAKEDQ